MSSSPPLNCGSGGGDTAFKGLRIASLFIIWASSSFAATFPIVANRSRVIHLPLVVFESVSLLQLPLFQRWISYQLLTGRPNILALALSSPLDSSTSSPPASASSPHPALEPHGKAMFAPLSDDNLNDNKSDCPMRCSPTPWHLLSYRLFPYLSSKLLPSVLGPLNSRSLASIMVRSILCKVHVVHITNTLGLLE